MKQYLALVPNRNGHQCSSTIARGQRRKILKKKSLLWDLAATDEMTAAGL